MEFHYLACGMKNRQKQTKGHTPSKNYIISLQHCTFNLLQLMTGIMIERWKFLNQFNQKMQKRKNKYNRSSKMWKMYFNKKFQRSIGKIIWFNFKNLEVWSPLFIHCWRMRLDECTLKSSIHGDEQKCTSEVFAKGCFVSASTVLKTMMTNIQSTWWWRICIENIACMLSTARS